MAKQFNDLPQKNNDHNGERTLMRAVHTLKPSYCVCILEKVQAVIHCCARE